MDLVDFVRIKQRDLDALRDITGHEYQSLEYGRIDGPEDFLPFVRGVRDSREIDIWSMSTSELWVHYVLAHLRDADENEVVLIDEPETFLAQPGHRAFIDEIARLTLASGCQTVVATHSDAMVRRIPAPLVRQVTRGPDGASFGEVLDAGALLRALGRQRERPPVSGLVFVEDDLASRIVRAMVGLYAPDRTDLFDVIDSGGKDQALQGAAIARRSQRLGAVAVLDGDQRGAESGAAALYLPGTTVPELGLLDGLRARESDAAEKLCVAVSDLRIALESVRFASHQRVFVSMSQALPGSSVDQIRDVAIDLWLQGEEIAAEARALVEELLKLARPDTVVAKRG